LRRPRTTPATGDTTSADGQAPPPAPPHADEPIAPSRPRPGGALLDVTSADDHIELGSDFVARAAARTARRRAAEAATAAPTPPAPVAEDAPAATTPAADSRAEATPPMPTSDPATAPAAPAAPATAAPPAPAPAAPAAATAAPAAAPTGAVSTPPVTPTAAAVIEVDTGAVRVVDAPSPTPAMAPPAPAPSEVPPPDKGTGVDFWALYTESQAMADLLDVPPTPVVAVVGPLEVAMTVARRCRSRHWIDGDSIVVHTERHDLVDEPSWEVLDDEALGRRLDEGGRPSAMFVIDAPGELTPDVTRIVRRLRADGPTLVHYVLDAEPSDDELATWHSRIGRPAVLDLFGPVDPARALALLDRGEPVASIAGVPVTAELIQALRIDVLDRP
ncbi:MAG: hypothetical protein AAGD35_16450, partial [Actinomycetota bacterium]